MDLLKLEGLISAIEDEAKQPLPSHHNLARLTALFFRALLEERIDKPDPGYLQDSTLTSSESTDKIESTIVDESDSDEDDKPTSPRRRAKPPKRSK